jgi:hypothetical protein
MLAEPFLAAASAEAWGILKLQANTEGIELPSKPVALFGLFGAIAGVHLMALDEGLHVGRQFAPLVGAALAHLARDLFRNVARPSLGGG